MHIKNLEEIFIHLLSGIYSAENQLIPALAELARESSNESLSTAFRNHLDETQVQIERLDQIIKDVPSIQIKRMKCVAIEGLIEEANEMIEISEKNEIRDIAFIAVAQKIEHYEIASYGTLVILAEQLGFKKIVQCLNETLNEEKAMNSKLTNLAVGIINR